VVRQAEYLVAVAFSWIFWTTAFARVPAAVGLWDPFGRVDFQGRRFMLRAWVRLHEWWEAQWRFGRGPTGALPG